MSIEPMILAFLLPQMDERENFSDRTIEVISNPGV
jgi:hypothetical protein